MIARDDTYFSCFVVVFGYNAIVKFSGWNTEELPDAEFIKLGIWSK